MIRTTTIRTALLFTFALALQGCASLSKDDCRVANWQDIGRRDGRNGYSEDRLMDHAKACAKVGVTPDRDAWLQGRDEGLESYCDPRHGFRIGDSGSGFSNGICRNYDEGAFISAFEEGRELYRLRGEIDQISQEMQNISHALENKELERKERERLAYQLGLLTAQRIDAQHRYDRARYESRYR
jgi:hypothetical protein